MTTIDKKEMKKEECIKSYGGHVADIKTINGRIKCFFCKKDLGKQRPAD